MFLCIANFTSPDVNIALPVFSIHGNHDDPATGTGTATTTSLCALDLLQAANLVNYFGRIENPNDITVSPVLIRKGTTRLAIYGMGNVRDERLNRTLANGNLKMLRPREDQDDWFSMLVLHQNRVHHSAKNTIRAESFPNFLDLAVWGHEHECLLDATFSPVADFFITQPGSSVATSLCEAESRKKYVGVLHVNGTQFMMEKHELRSVRPFIIQDVTLSTAHIDAYNEAEVTEFLSDKVHQMIAEVGAAHDDDGPAADLLPLVRLKVEYTDAVSINPQKFGKSFVSLVANSESSTSVVHIHVVSRHTPFRRRVLRVLSCAHRDTLCV
jgi:double-strand break repair protein MRE11